MVHTRLVKFPLIRANMLHVLIYRFTKLAALEI